MAINPPAPPAPGISPVQSNGQAAADMQATNVTLKGAMSRQSYMRARELASGKAVDPSEGTTDGGVINPSVAKPNASQAKGRARRNNIDINSNPGDYFQGNARFNQGRNGRKQQPMPPQTSTDRAAQYVSSMKNMIGSQQGPVGSMQTPPQSTMPVSPATGTDGATPASARRATPVRPVAPGTPPVATPSVFQQARTAITQRQPPAPAPKPPISAQQGSTLAQQNQAPAFGAVSRPPSTQPVNPALTSDSNTKVAPSTGMRPQPGMGTPARPMQGATPAPQPGGAVRPAPREMPPQASGQPGNALLPAPKGGSIGGPAPIAK